MSRSSSYDSILLRTIDIGEADRFCIFYTRERGRLASRAKSVRKTTSRLGGTLLPFRHLKLQLSESDHGSVITGATDAGDLPTTAPDFNVFVRLEKGMELLLALTEENEPIPQLFDLLLQFIALAPSDDCDPLPAFQLRLLHLLGHLPATQEDRRFHALSMEAQLFVIAATRSSSLDQLCRMPYPAKTIDTFIRSVVDELVGRPLKSAGIG